jgi:hypothetical protein
MNLADIDAELESISKQEEELRKDREALLRVRVRYASRTPLGDAPIPARNSVEAPPVSLSAAIRDAISVQKGTFTNADIAKYIGEHHPQLKPKERMATLATIVGSFKGKLVRVKLATAGMPNIYEKI